MSISDISHVFDERREDIAPYGLTCEQWRPSLMRRPDRHNEIELNLLQGGSITYLLRGKRCQIRPRRLTIFWALAPHQIIDFEGKIPYYVATIPLTSFLQWKLPSMFVNRVLQGNVIEEFSEDLASVDIAMFERWLRDVKEGDLQLLEIMLLEMEARMRRLSLTYAKQGVDVEHVQSFDEGHSSKVEQMAAFIANNYKDSIQIKDIADAVDLHPDYATALFKKTFGITLRDHLFDHRISHAQRTLVTTSSKITEIAYDSGFNSVSRFNVAFKKLCGCTPRQYRRDHQLIG